MEISLSLVSFCVHRRSKLEYLLSNEDHLPQPSESSLHTSRVTTDVHFQKDLGLDSLDNVEIVMALKEEFKLEIPDKEANKIDSSNLAIEYIYNHPLAG
ncbi:acyl carrier protein 1, mitochondrial [Fagus crenata]